MMRGKATAIFPTSEMIRGGNGRVVDKPGVPRMSTFALFVAYTISFVSLFDRFGLGRFRYIAILLVALYLLLNLRSLLAVLGSRANVVFACFFGWVVMAASVNAYRVPFMDIVQNATVDLAAIFEVGLIIAVCARIGQFRRVVELFFYWQLALVLFNDVLVLLVPGLFGMESSVLPSYLVGNKFSVVFCHILLMVFYLMRRDGWGEHSRVSMLAFVSLVVLTGVISVIVDCMTGVVGTIAFLVFYVLASRYPKGFIRPLTLVAILLLACSFMFVYDDVLSNSVARFVLENVLDTTSDITGRGPIYEQMPALLSAEPLFGYGYGTCHVLGPVMGNFLDTQNGLAEWAWKAGIPSVVLIIAFLWVSASSAKRCVSTGDPHVVGIFAPLVAAICTFSLLASVEISIGSSFFIVLFMVSAAATDFGFGSTSQERESRQLGNQGGA